MRALLVFTAVALVAACVSSIHAQVGDTSSVTPPTLSPPGDDGNPDAAPRCEFVTLQHGFHSGFGQQIPGFAGATFVIRDARSWQAFWTAHTQNDSPSPPAPQIDFQRRTVVVAVQGPQTSGGGPNIEVLGLERTGNTCVVTIFDDERPGPLDVLTNPFHIVIIPRRCLPDSASVAFVRVHPEPATGVLLGRVLAQASDTTESRPVPGALIALHDDTLSEARVTHAGMDGTYFFVNVAPGAHALHVQAAGFEPADLAVAVAPDAFVHRDVVLIPLPPPPTGGFSGLVRGLQTDGSSIPLANALVRVLDNDAVVAAARTNLRGFFAIPSIPVGSYVAVASQAGWQPADTPLEITADNVTEHVFLLAPSSASDDAQAAPSATTAVDGASANVQ